MLGRRNRFTVWLFNMGYSLNSLEIIYGSTIGVIKGDTRSVDYAPNPKP